MHPGHLQLRVMMFAEYKIPSARVWSLCSDAVILQAIRDFLYKATGTDTCSAVKNTAAAAVLQHQSYFTIDFLVKLQ